MFSTCGKPTPDSVKKVWAHGGCPDGDGALTVAKLYEQLHRRHNPIEIGYLFHKQDFASLSAKGDSVVVFDFSFDEKTTARFIQEAQEFAVFDHHKGQESVMSKFPHHCQFDNTRSGARLAWDFFFPDHPPPPWVNYIEDRDLWKWQYPETKPFGLYMHFMTDRNPDKLATAFRTGEPSMQRMIEMGQAAQIMEEKMIEIQCNQMICSYFLGHHAGIGNVNLLISEVCDKFLKKHPDYAIALVYRLDSETKMWTFSIRSRPGGINCIPIAQKFGGNGHAVAAGFSVAEQDVIGFLIKHLKE